MKVSQYGVENLKRGDELISPAGLRVYFQSYNSVDGTACLMKTRKHAWGNSFPDYVVRDTFGGYEVIATIDTSNIPNDFVL